MTRKESTLGINGKNKSRGHWKPGGEEQQLAEGGVVELEEKTCDSGSPRADLSSALGCRG